MKSELLLEKMAKPMIKHRSALPDNMSVGMYYPFGIVNPGVHCYLISILQCFAALYDHLEVTDAIGDWKNPHLSTFNNFLAFLRILRNGSPGSSLSEKSLYEAFTKINSGLFPETMRQGDSTEAFGFLVNLSEEARWRKKFKFVLDEKKICTFEHKSHKNLVSEEILMLPIPNPNRTQHLEDITFGIF